MPRVCSPIVPYRRMPTGLPGGSDYVDILGLRPLDAAAGDELDPLVRLEAAETASLDGGVVNEDVGSAIVGGDETIALVGVERLHCALSHYALSCLDDPGAACAAPGLLRSRRRLRMAGGPVHDLAQRQHHTAESADCGPLGAGALLGDLRWHGRGRWPWWGGAVSGWERPGGGGSRIRVGRGWLGHGVFPLGGGGR